MIAQAELAEALEGTLYLLRQQRGEAAWSKPALEYLNDWAANDKAWLRKFYPPGSDEPHFDLTPATERAGWLQHCSLHHWGDIDSHGFAILDELRGHFPHAQSLLMDRDTLLAHEPLWVDEPEPTQRDLPRLNEEERRLCDDLRWRRLRPAALRLEQERIAFGRVQQAVAALRDADPIETGAS